LTWALRPVLQALRRPTGNHDGIGNQAHSSCHYSPPDPGPGGKSAQAIFLDCAMLPAD